MDVLDLFSGLGGWSKAFKDRGHQVLTVDIDKKFDPDICKDIMKIKSISELGDFDIILASPPCQRFSVAAISKNWKDGKPRNKETIQAIQLIKHTKKLLEKSGSKYWIIENPRGMMRKVIGLPQAEVTYCQYGLPVMKPTDLWGKIPPGFVPKRCKNRSPCHQSAPRGSKSGTQGIAFKKNKCAYLVKDGGGNSALRALIPYSLSLEVCIAMEKNMV